MTKEERLIKERERLKAMYLGQSEISGGAEFCFGIDEAGRGPLCGPVVAACCLLPDDYEILYLNDSKKLSEKKREEVYAEVIEHAIAYGIGIVGPERIDEINILNATYEAMTDAFKKCKESLVKGGNSFDLMRDLSVILVDGNRSVPYINEKQITVVGGDAKCPSIAAASCIAKVSRDRLLMNYDMQYPEYGFAKHKGYGTKEHIEAIKKYGPLPIHRRSFIKNFI
ncbi:MAG: ribonuclease HII [Eubacteriales bacterium]|nr:ribonuclease HII [Eubacteriales bacterium]